MVNIAPHFWVTKILRIRLIVFCNDPFLLTLLMKIYQKSIKYNLQIVSNDRLLSNYGIIICSIFKIGNFINRQRFEIICLHSYTNNQSVQSDQLYKLICWAVSGRANILLLLRHENLYPVPSAVSNSN